MAGANINTVVLTGNLTRDPELRHIGSGTAVVDLGLAVNSREKRGDEWVDRADFFDITVWGARAESCDQYLSKGSPVAVTGKLRLEQWENKEGEKRSKVKVVAKEVQFLSTKGGGGNSGSGGGQRSDTSDFDSPASDVPAASSEDDIPF